MLSEQNEILNRLTLCLIELIKELEALNLEGSLSDERLNALINEAVQKANLGASEARVNELIQIALSGLNLGVDEDFITQKINEALSALNVGTDEAKVNELIEVKIEPLNEKIDENKANLGTKIDETRLNESLEPLNSAINEKIDEARARELANEVVALANLSGGGVDEAQVRALINSTLATMDLKGETGEKGEKGDKGEQGLQGEKGETGERGADGKSAFELWLEKSENAGKSEEDFFNALGTKQEVTEIYNVNASIGGGVAGVKTNTTPPQDDIGLPLGYVWVNEASYPYQIFVLQSTEPLNWQEINLNMPQKIMSFDLVLSRKNISISYNAVCISNIIIVAEDGTELRVKSVSDLSYEALGGVSITPNSPSLKAYNNAAAVSASSQYSINKALAGTGAFLSAATTANAEYTISFTFSEAVRIKGVKLNPFGNVSTRDWCPYTKIALKNEDGVVLAQKEFDFTSNAQANAKGFISCDINGNEL